MPVLRADRIELAILNLLVDYNDARGRTFRIPTMQSWLMPTIGDTSDREVIDSLMTLFEDGIVAIERFMGQAGYVPYQLEEGTAYFCGPDIRCRAKPRARRRQQELSGGNRTGIFVSHFGPESPIALHLKKFILASFTPAIPVFVSSDYDSIPSGEWFQKILEGLRKSEAIICLLSPVSIERRWINFEAGFGFGAESEVIPLVWGKLDKSAVGMPLGQLQARALGDPGDVKAMMKALATRCRLSFNESSLDAFVEALPAIEAKVPFAELAVRLFRSKGGVVQLSIQNMGTRQLDMVEAELLMPQQLNRDGANWFNAWEPVTEHRRFKGANGINYVGIALTVHPANRSYLGIDPLRPIITPEMGEYVVPGIGIHLPPNLSPDELALPICYSVQSRQAHIGPEFLPISEIPFGEFGD